MDSDEPLQKIASALSELGYEPEKADDVATALGKIAGELRRLREERTCPGHCCGHVHYYPYYPVTSVASGGWYGTVITNVPGTGSGYTLTT